MLHSTPVGLGGIRRLIFLVGVLGGILSCPAFATLPVIFSGLEKTDPQYAQWLFDRCLLNLEPPTKTDAAAADAPKAPAAKQSQLQEGLSQCLMNTKHFAEVSVIHSGGLGYKVVVKERMTLLVLPQIQSERAGAVKYGLFLVDSHFMGRGILGVLGLSKGRYTENAFVFVNHNKRRYPYIVYGGYSRDEIYLFDGEAEIDGLVESRRIGRVMLGKRLSSEATLYGSLRTENRSYGSLGDFALDQKVDTHQVGLQLSYRKQDYLLYFDHGLRARFQAYGSVYQSGNPSQPMQSYELDFTLGLRGFADHALTVQGYTGYINGGVVTDKLRLGDQQGFRGVPRDGIWAESFGTLAIDYHVPLWRAGFGTVTLAPFLDRGLVINRLRSGATTQSERARKVDFMAYGVGSYVFLKQVAVPGLGLIFGHNPRYGGTFFSFSIGISN